MEITCSRMIVAIILALVSNNTAVYAIDKPSHVDILKNLPRFFPADYDDFSAVEISYAGAWIEMSNKKIPKIIMNALPREVREYFSSSDIYKNAALEFALIDLNGDDKDEIFVINPVFFGSGGRNFLILQEVQPRKWKTIGEIPGGPIFHRAHDRRKQNPYYRITTYWRFGTEVTQFVFDNIGGRYRLTNEVDVPRYITETCWWYAHWQQRNLYGSMDENFVRKECARKPR